MSFFPTSGGFLSGAYLPLSGGTLTGPILLPNGSASEPALRFGVANTGIFRTGGGNVAFSVTGVQAFAVSNTQILIAAPTNFFGNWVDMLERAEPSAPTADYARLFARDDGAGKTQLCVRFASGASQVIATQP
jgi:hypothetical protein